MGVPLGECAWREFARGRTARKRHRSISPPPRRSLTKACNPDQARFYPYIAGYVAFYGGDYKTAIAELQKADQKDLFVLSLLAQAYEKSGDKAKAMECYKQVLTINSHSPGNAFARPLAERKDQGRTSLLRQVDSFWPDLHRCLWNCFLVDIRIHFSGATAPGGSHVTEILVAYQSCSFFLRRFCRRKPWTKSLPRTFRPAAAWTRSSPCRPFARPAP